MYDENFYLCSDEHKKHFTDKKMLSISNKLENRIQIRDTVAAGNLLASDRQRSNRKKKKHSKKRGAPSAAAQQTQLVLPSSNEAPKEETQKREA